MHRESLSTFPSLLLPLSDGDGATQRRRLGRYITMSPAAAEQDAESLEGRRAFWQERRAGNGNADKEAGMQTREQPVAELGPVQRQIAGIDPWEPQAEGGEPFRGLTDEWTPAVAARL